MLFFFQDCLEHVAVMHGGIRDLVFPNEFVLDVHLDIVLVAEAVFAPFLRPACIRIFLALLRIAPVLDGSFFLLDRLVFLPCVALKRNSDNRRVNILPPCGRASKPEAVRQKQRVLGHFGKNEASPD